MTHDELAREILLKAICNEHNKIGNSVCKTYAHCDKCEEFTNNLTVEVAQALASVSREKEEEWSRKSYYNDMMRFMNESKAKDAQIKGLRATLQKIADGDVDAGHEAFYAQNLMDLAKQALYPEREGA